MNPTEEAMALEHLENILHNAKYSTDEALMEYEKIENYMGGQHRDVQPKIKNRLRAIRSNLKISIDQLKAVIDDMRENIRNRR